MPTLTIDNRTITVPEGTSVLDAAEKLGIVVPHFCYHKALGEVGACRLCAVYIETDQNSGVQMSCLVEAKDGMQVNTLDPTAVELRQSVIEWLMINHPHDCPVCDEGGECQLQDMTIAGGHSIRKYRGKKRTYENQDLGPFIEQEMNRCIQCYRCVRTYRDYFGGDDFGTLGSRDRVFFGRFRSGRLTSQFSGNLADVCPTGVFTDKTFRFRSRYWDMQEADSICPHCSLGCATIPGARYRELQRIRAGINLETNGHFICDRGRFGYGFVNNPTRPRRPRAGGTETGWEEALGLTRSAISRLTDDLGGNAMAWLGSSRASLEANWLLRKMAEQAGSDRIVFECHPQRDRSARTVVALKEKNCSQDDMRNSDFILLVGSDPLNEAPMLAAALRQAVRKGAHVAVIDPRPVELPFAASHLPAAPAKIPLLLQALKNGKLDGFARHEMLFLEGVMQNLRKAAQPVLVGGSDLLQVEGVEALFETARSVSQECAVFVHLSGPNSYGAAMLAGDGPCFEALLDQILDGKIRGLVCLETDPFHDYPDPARVQAALARLEILIVMDYLAGEAAKRADIFLPVTAPAESDGVYVNNEGRMQAFSRVMEPGEPLWITGRGDHPPREFSSKTPGAEPWPAIRAMAALLDTEPDLQTIRIDLQQEDDRFAGVAGIDPGSDGALVEGGGKMPPPAESAIEERGAQDSLQILPICDLLGSGALTANSPVFDTIKGEAHIIISAQDAENLDIADGERVALQSALGKMHIQARVDSRVSPGLVLLPHFDRSGSGAFLPGAGTFACRLLKEGK